MEIYTLNLRSSDSYRFTTILDQVTYQLRMNWIAKEDAWYMDIYDGANDPLILGHKLLYGNIILDKYHADSRVPKGEFAFVSGLSSDLLRPTYDSVSKGDALYYFSVEDLT